MKNNDMDYDFENDPFLDSLSDVIRTCEPYPRLLNGKRYLEMLLAKEAIDDLLEQSDSGKSRISLHPMFCSGSVIAEVDDLVVQDFTAMQVVFSLADNFEIYPLTNGRMRIAFTFNHIMTILHECKNKNA